MTYKELYAKNATWCSYIKASDVAQCNCPSEFFDCAYDPDYCDDYDDSNPCVCEECWNREVPEEYVNDINSLPHILDSGNRREFETGAVRDIQEGKGRCDLLPLDVVADLFHYEWLADTNGGSNVVSFACNVFDCIFKFVDTGDTKNLYDAIYHSDIFKSYADMLLEVSKHFEEGAKKYGDSNWQKGIPVRCYIDSAVRHYLKYLRGDKDEPHDRAFYWNLMCAIWTCKHKPELNDYRACTAKEEC